MTEKTIWLWLKEIIRKSQNVTEIMSRFGNGMTGDFQTNGEARKEILRI